MSNPQLDLLRTAYNYGKLVNSKGVDHYLNLKPNKPKKKTRLNKIRTYIGFNSKKPKNSNETILLKRFEQTNKNKLVPLFYWAHLPYIIHMWTVHRGEQKRIMTEINELKPYHTRNMPSENKERILAYLNQVKKLSDRNYEVYLKAAEEIFEESKPPPPPPPPPPTYDETPNISSKIELSSNNINDLLKKLNSLKLPNQLTNKQKKDLELLLQLVYKGGELTLAQQGMGLKEIKTKGVHSGLSVSEVQNIGPYWPQTLKVKENIIKTIGESAPTIIFFTKDFIKPNKLDKFTEVKLGTTVYYTTLDPELISNTIKNFK